MIEQPPTVFNEEEFGNLFSKYRIHFINIAFSYVRDEDAAKDIVADSFMYVWEHREELDWGRNIKGYVYLGIRNRCISYLRKQQSLLKAQNDISRAAWKVQSSLDSLSNNDLSKKLFQSEIIEIFRQELVRMPKLTRTVFMASRRDDLTYHQIAEKYRLTNRRVTSEIQKALEILRLSLTDYLPLIIIMLFTSKME